MEKPVGGPSWWWITSCMLSSIVMSPQENNASKTLNSIQRIYCEEPPYFGSFKNHTRMAYKYNNLRYLDFQAECYKIITVAYFFTLLVSF